MPAPTLRKENRNSDKVACGVIMNNGEGYIAVSSDKPPKVPVGETPKVRPKLQNLS